MARKRHWGAGVLAGVLVLAGCGPVEADLDVLEDEEQEEPAAELITQEAPLPGFEERTLGYMAAADARIDAASPDQALGGRTRMRIDASPESRSLLRFNVGGIFSPVVSAKLRLYATAPSRGTPQLFLAPGGWREDTVTWNTRPLVTGAPVWTARPVPDDAWVEFDVTDVITRDGEYNFQLAINSTDGASFVTRESTLYALVPQLLIDTEPNNCQAGLVRTNEARWPDQTVSVASSEPHRTYLRPSVLTVDGAPRREAYLRFGVDHRGRKLVSAKLRMWAETGSANGPVVRAVDGKSWGGTTWNTRPSAVGPPLADVGRVSSGSWVEYDLTEALVDRTGPYGSTGTGFDFELALVPSGPDGVTFGSPYARFLGERPHLALTYEVPCLDPVEGQ